MLHPSAQRESDPCPTPDGGFPAKCCATIKQSHRTGARGGGGGAGWACRDAGWGGGRAESERNSC